MCAGGKDLNTPNFYKLNKEIQFRTLIITLWNVFAVIAWSHFWEDVCTHIFTHTGRTLVTMVTIMHCQQSLLPPSISSPLSLPPLLGSNLQEREEGGLLLPSCFAGWSRKKPEAVNEQHSGQRYIEKQSDGGCSGISQGGMADVASCLYSSCSFSLGEFSLILI